MYVTRSILFDPLNGYVMSHFMWIHILIDLPCAKGTDILLVLSFSFPDAPSL